MEGGIDDLDHLLTRGEPVHDLLAQRTRPDPLDEGAHHLEVDIRFEEGDTNLAQGEVEMFRGQSPLSAEIPDDLLQLVGECFKHDSVGSASPF